MRAGNPDDPLSCPSPDQEADHGPTIVLSILFVLALIGLGTVLVTVWYGLRSLLHLLGVGG